MAGFHSLHRDEHVLTAHVYTFCALEDIFELSAASAGCRKMMEKGCQVVRVCVVPTRIAFRDKVRATRIVDAWYGTNFENDKDFHSFPTQGWSQRSLTAKMAVNEDVWNMCCAAFLAGSVEEFVTEVHRCLRCVQWLAAEIRLERIVGLRVPVASIWEAGPAIGQLRGPVTLGMACWEEKCVEKDWMGNSCAWWWGCCNTNIFDFTEGLLPERPVDMSPGELCPGFRFVDDLDRTVFARNARHDLRRAMFQILPGISGLFEDRLSPRDLSCVSAAAKQSLTRLGCMYISGAAALPGEHEWPSFGPFPLVEEISVEVQDFYCGSDAWPPGLCCRRHSQCAAASAKTLSTFLKWLFPAAHRVSLFFDFPYGDAVPYPTPGVTAMMRTLVSDMETNMGSPIDVEVGIIGIWELDLDSLDTVEALCQPGWRRDGLLAAWAGSDGEHGLEGGFHSV